MKENKASYTAAKVALSIVMLDSDPEMKHRLPHNLCQATADLLLSSGNSIYSKSTIKKVQAGKFKLLLKFFSLFSQTIAKTPHLLGYRKIFCERQVRAAIAEGATQVLVLGGGYDTLCWRLAPEFPDIVFLEIDHPATGAYKAKGIKAMGHPPNLSLVKADLGETSLVDALKAHSQWSIEAPAVILAEGLLMYLRPEDVKTLFERAAQICGSGSRFGFDHLYPGKNGQPDMGAFSSLAHWGLKLTGEPMLWSIEPHHVANFIKDTGWYNAPEAIGSPNAWGPEAFAVLLKD